MGIDSSRTRRSDAYKTVLDTMTFIIVACGLYFAYDQAVQFNRGQNLTNWSDVTARTCDVDKVFVDHPDIQRYFFEGVEANPSDPDYQLASATAVMMLDYFDSVMTRLEFNRNRLSENILQSQAWEHYFQATFSTSSLMCRKLLSDPASYGTDMQRIGVAACARYKSK